MPLETLRRTRFFLFDFATAKGLWKIGNRDVRNSVECELTQVLDAFFAGNRLPRAFTGASIGLGTLTTNR